MPSVWAQSGGAANTCHAARRYIRVAGAKPPTPLDEGAAEPAAAEGAARAAKDASTDSGAAGGGCSKESEEAGAESPTPEELANLRATVGAGSPAAILGRDGVEEGLTFKAGIGLRHPLHPLCRPATSQPSWPASTSRA